MSNQEISEDVRNIANTLKQRAEIDEDSGTVSLDKGSYEATLPDGLDMDTVKRVYGHTERFVAGMTLANAEIGEDLHKRKGHDYVQAQTEVPRHLKFSTAWYASKEQRKAPDSKETVTRHGVTSARVHTKAQDPQSGEMKKVRDHARQRAEELLTQGKKK